MRIVVKVKANSKAEKIEILGKNEFVLRVKAKPIDGLANEAVVRVLSEYFKVPKIRINIVKGLKSKLKVIDVA